MSSYPPPTNNAIEVDAVLFDMDGTLIDSTPVVERLWTEFAIEYGIEPAVLLSYSHGRQTHATVSRFLPEGFDPAEVTAAFERSELRETDGIVEIPGAHQLLQALAGARVGVVTSAKRPLALLRFAAAGLAIPKVFVTADLVTRGKPDPEGYVQAAQLLGTEPARCLVVEDAEAGIRSGLAAGSSVLVVGTHHSEVTEGLPRVPDLTHVTAEAVGDRVQLRWA
ncbi:HAD-IA family hydrolase [Actinomycetaceae bacterium L2_0104]